MSLVGDRHSPPSSSSSAKVVLALDSALSMFGEQVKEAIYFQLKLKGISLEESGASQIEGALRDMFASGAEIIIAA